MTSTWKNVYIVKLDGRVNKFNNTYHKIIKMKPIDVKPSMYINFNKGNNKEDPKFKVGDNVRISKFKNVFAKCYIWNWHEDSFVIKFKRMCRGDMLLVILIKKKLLEQFAKNNTKNKSKRNLELKKIKRKGNKLYIK